MKNNNNIGYADGIISRDRYLSAVFSSVYVNSQSYELKCDL